MKMPEDEVMTRIRVPATTANMGPGYDVLGRTYALCIF